MDSSARQAMLDEQEKPKTIDNVALDPDWLTARYKMEKREMWLDTNQKARYDRNFCGTLVNIFYFFLLITELVLFTINEIYQMLSMTSIKTFFVN